MHYIDTGEGNCVALQLKPLKCLRCGNEEEGYFGTYHSYTLKREIYYCRACLIYGRVSEKSQVSWLEICIPETLQYQFPTFMPELTDIQQTCVQQIRHNLESGEKTLDVIAVTGAGKTEMMLEITNDFLIQKKSVAFICPRIDVIRELYQRVEKYFPEHIVIGWHSGNHERRLGHIYVMTMHQMIHYQHFFDLIIIDEADAFPFVEQNEAKMLRRFIERGLKSGGVRIYMTATPKKHHGKSVYLMTKFNKRKLPKPMFVHIPYFTKKLKYGWRVKQFQQLKRGKWLVFVPSVGIGECVYTYILNVMKLSNVASVHSADPLRVEKIEQFRNDDLNVLITTSILERGVTFDSISVLVLFPEHDLMTEEMIVQVCGRVDRGVIEMPYYLEAYYEVYTDKISRIYKRIEEMNRLDDNEM